MVPATEQTDVLAVEMLMNGLGIILLSLLKYIF